MRVDCKLYFILIWIFSFLSTSSIAQLKKTSIFHPGEALKGVANSQARIAAGDPLTLPFWDDFSTSRQFPDTSLWINSQHVSIVPGTAILAPTINVAVFDGADVNGNTYSNNAVNSGPADSLVSKPIDLTTVGAANQSTIFLSFFWQLKGNGENPDPEDSIRLQFKDIMGNWHTVWSMAGGDGSNNDVFTQEFIAVNPVTYLGENFQFKFQSFSNLSGSFDTWLLDYILLNQGRNGTNQAHFDHALTSLPTSLFGKYTALPSSQFYSTAFDPDTILTPSEVDYYNLDNQLQPIQYTAIVKDTLSGQVLDTLNFLTDDESIPMAFQRDKYSTNIFDLGTLPMLDTAMLEMTFSIKTGDTLLIDQIIGMDTIYSDRFDLRNNDTVRNYFIIHDYIAYDDGSAEFGAGVNSSGGQLAYQYRLFEQDTITGVDIFFPNIGTNFAGSSIDICVWSDLEGGQSSILAREPTVVKNTIGHNVLQTYPIDPPVVVSGTFYVGYIQSISDLLTVGLDVNTDTGDDIYFNVTGAWQQNDDIQGSLMMRPRFGRGAIITGINEKPTHDHHVKAYPNPSWGSLAVEGLADEIGLYTIHGQEVKVKITRSSPQKHLLDLSGLVSGIYFLKVTYRQESVVERILLDR